MLSTLAREHGHELTNDELAAIGHLMLIAGYETTANMLALGTVALLRRFPTLRLAEPPADVQLRAFGIIHGVTNLPVTW